MAPRKSTTRKKRPARGKSSGQSAAAVVTVGAIVALGAAALWATSQSRSPTASVSGLFRTNNSSVARTNPPAAKTGSTSTESKTAQTRASEPAAPAPIRRPQVNVGEQKQVAVLAPRVENKPATQIVPPKPAAQSAMPALPPVGKTAPEDNSRHASGAFKIPKAIIAKQALNIREKAWDQAKTVGRVEKGREMRSYAKVGRWHRVVVPSTNIIGWVQEDQLVFKNQPRQTTASRAVAPQRSAITTGSIRPAPVTKSTNDKPQNTGLIAPVYPQQPVGK